MHLISALDEALIPLEISSDEFSELVIRLLDYGVINREESQIEQTLYDRYLQCAELVAEYLSILKLRIQHDRQFSFIRVFPPGAEVPGLPDDDAGAFSGGFRNRPSQQEVAVILALRVEYEKSLREGQVDEKGQVLLPVEGLAIAMKNLLKRSLPDNQTERKNLFKRLRQLRLVHFNSDMDLDSAESWLRIQPAITSFVNDDVLDALYPPNEDKSSDTEPSDDELADDTALDEASAEAESSDGSEDAAPTGEPHVL